MSEHVVDEEILNNMGSLEGLLSERGYTTATVPMQGETVVRNEFGPGAPPVSAQDPYAAPGASPQDVSGVVPQPVPAAQPVQQYVQPQQPQISVEQYQAAMAYAQRMEQAAQESARNLQEAEDLRFLASIEHLPQVEQDREILIRYNKQLEAAYQGVTTERQTELETREEQEQLDAKEQVAWTLAMRNRLPWENEGVRAAILAAPDRRTMDSIVAGLAQYATPARNGAAQTPAQIAGQVVAAPARGSNSGTRPNAVKPGSGDLAGYLKSKPYQIGQ